MENNHKPFKGYGLKELRYRMVVNTAKQQAVKTRIDDAVGSVTSLGKKFSAFTSGEHDRKSGLIGKIDAVLSLGNYAMAGFDLFKQIKSSFRKEE